MRTLCYTQLAKMSFDKIFDLTAGVYFNFCNNLRMLMIRENKIKDNIDSNNNNNNNNNLLLPPY